MLEPMSYPGGKGGDGVYQRIINLMPPHDVYIEPFLGGASIWRQKRPAALSFGLDLDPEPLKVAGPPGSDRTSLELAGDHGAWSTRSPKMANGAALADARNRRNWRAAPSTVAETGAPSSRFGLIEGDGITFLENYAWTGRELVYCDPPYLMSTRSGKRLYEHEMDDLQHRRLLRVVRKLPCMVMISGYSSVLYARELRDWHACSFPAMTRGGTERAEWLWYNFPPPVELHDYRYLGRDFRERERIKRQKARWVARIERMQPLQRQAMLAAIASISGSGEGRSTHALHNKI